MLTELQNLLKTIMLIDPLLKLQTISVVQLYRKIDGAPASVPTNCGFIWVHLLMGWKSQRSDQVKSHTFVRHAQVRNDLWMPPTKRIKTLFDCSLLSVVKDVAILGNAPNEDNVLINLRKWCIEISVSEFIVFPLFVFI